jgi:hypothetical protein
MISEYSLMRSRWALSEVNLPATSPEMNVIQKARSSHKFPPVCVRSVHQTSLDEQRILRGGATDEISLARL